MGDPSEFSLGVRLFLKAYRWRRIDPVPWTPLRKPLRECRVGLVTSAGFALPDQPPFDHSIKGGDWSFREIPVDVDVSQLGEGHRSESFDHRGIQADPNLAFPIDRLRELQTAGRIGELGPRHLSFMGSLTAVGRLIQDSAVRAAQMFVRDQVDVALFVPV